MLASRNSRRRFPLIVLVSVAIVVTACERQSPESVTPKRSDLAEQPAHESWGTELYLSKDAAPVVRIRSPYTRRYDRPDSTLTLLSGMQDQRVVATIFDASGKTTATVTADEMQYVEEQDRFDAFGAVEVLADDGKSLETEHLYWLEDTKMLYAPGFAKLFDTDRYIQGYDLEATEDLSSYTLARVTGEVPVEE